METRRARRIKRKRMRRVGLLVAGIAALGVTGATVGPASAAGGNGTSFCSNAMRDDNPAHPTNVTQFYGPQAVANVCNPNRY